jgi:hypothetical protein
MATEHPQERNKVFISYSHADREWLRRLQVHLRPLERDLSIRMWDDTRIEPGELWHDEIEKALRSALVAVLLVSADFLASEFIANEELPHLLEAARAEGTIILPLIVSPCRFTKTNLSRFQAVNDPAEPLISVSKGEQEAVFVRVADRVESAFSERQVQERFSQVHALLDQTLDRISKLFLFTMSGPMYENLQKLARKEGFGHWRMTSGLRRELYHLRDIGYIHVDSVQAIPGEGPDLSAWVRISDTGRQFVELRELAQQEYALRNR